jgi:hypothetical protein
MAKPSKKALDRFIVVFADSHGFVVNPLIGSDFFQKIIWRLGVVFVRQSESRVLAQNVLPKFLKKVNANVGYFGRT